MDLALTDRRVLITGGSQGVGKAIARGFLAEGARVAIVSRDPARLEAALAELAAGGRVEGKAVDLSQRGAPEAVADAFRDVDILINNAGAIPTGDIFSVTVPAISRANIVDAFAVIIIPRPISSR